MYFQSTTCCGFWVDSTTTSGVQNRQPHTVGQLHADYPCMGRPAPIDNSRLAINLQERNKASRQSTIRNPESIFLLLLLAYHSHLLTTITVDSGMIVLCVREGARANNYGRASLQSAARSVVSLTGPPLATSPHRSRRYMAMKRP